MEFAAFVSARQAALLRFATVLCGDSSLAQDLVQDALMRAHSRWERIEVMAAPEAYLFRDQGQAVVVRATTSRS